MTEPTSGEVRAFDLTESEAMLYENADVELRDATEAAKAIYRRRADAILRDHGLDPASVREGHFQPDPLVAGKWRFLYRVEGEAPPLALPPGRP